MRIHMLHVILSLLVSISAYSQDGDPGKVVDFQAARKAREPKSESLPTDVLATEIKPLTKNNKVVSFKPKAQAAPADPDAYILPLLDDVKQQAERLIKVSQLEDFKDLTQNNVNILVRNIHSFEESQMDVESYRQWSSTAGKHVDEVLEAQKRALETIKSSKLYERLEQEGYYVKLVPTSLLKETLPKELLQQLRFSSLSNQVLEVSEFTSYLSITPGLTRMREAMRLPSRDAKRYLSRYSKVLDLSLEILEQARSYLSKNSGVQYDLEPIDHLIRENRASLSSRETKIGLSLLRKSLIKSDRQLADDVQSKMKRIETILGYIEKRGQFSAKPVADSAPVSTREKSHATQVFDDLLTGSPETQDKRYSKFAQTLGEKNDRFIDYLFVDGAYREGLTTDELVTIARRLSDRLPESKKHQVPDAILALYRKLGSRFSTPLRGHGATVTTMKIAAVLHGLGNEASYHALELINAESPILADRATVFSVERDEFKNYFNELVTDLKAQHPEYQSSLTAGKRMGICVKSFVLTKLPLP